MRKRQFTHAAGLLAASLAFGRWQPVRAAAAPGAPALLLAQNAGPGLDLSRYLVSEKYDGVRAYWDGERMWSRQGHAIAVPAEIAAQLPRRQLDGELWIARGRFDAASAAVRRLEPQAAEWTQLKYMLFELPQAPGGFAQRYEALRELVGASRWPGLQVVDQSRLASASELAARLASTVRAGGEGLMLHEADAPYMTGRQPVLLKLKPQDDDEAVVLGHVAGAGRLAGMMGALRVRDAAGREFSIGSGFNEAQRRAPPPVGTTIVYRHRGLTASGLPRFATFVRTLEG